MVVSLDNRTPMERAELAAFARKLNELMTRAGMSQSDLARQLWGSTMDARGRDVARNRDRISHYVRGNQLPEAKTMRRLADVFGVDVADLNPALARPETRDGRGPPAEVGLSVVAGTGRALLTVNKMMPMDVAVKIIALLAESDKEPKTDGDNT